MDSQAESRIVLIRGLPKISPKDQAMPEQETVERAKQDAREGKSPSTQAGEFVKEEIKHVREGKHGARNAKQAIAIGLSKARRAGVKLPLPKKGRYSAKIRRQAKRDSAHGRSGNRKVSPNRSRGVLKALRREGHRSASRTALGRQARSSARQRGRRARHSAALRAVHTKGRAGLRRAARKAARTRNKNR
jgi:hypothetical protein